MNYEKRSLNMEYSESDILMRLQKGLENSDMWAVVNFDTTDRLAFVKDYLSDGTPCWRLPTQEEKNKFDNDKETKYEI